MWTCEFVFGLVSSYLDGCDKQKKTKKTYMMTCRVAAQLKTYLIKPNQKLNIIKFETTPTSIPAKPSGTSTPNSDSESSVTEPVPYYLSDPQKVRYVGAARSPLEKGAKPPLNANETAGMDVVGEVEVST